MIPEEIKAVFFDAGGTLFHPYPSVGEIYARVAAPYGTRADAGELQKVFKDAWMKRDGLASLKSHSNEKIEKDWWRSLVKEVFLQVGGVERFDPFFEELYDVFASPEVWRLYPEVTEVLNELKGRGKRLAIISNWDSRLFELCHGLGVKSYFEFILASAVVGASKPSPRIFEEALQRMGITASEALHVGDSYEDDVLGAERVGIQVILVDRHAERKGDFSASRTLKMVSGLRELLG
ncbi:MAG: HAD-IA family hydrolase [Candidatus Omnitrophica bacterium]|nr:HAD-IA family hydrolase [Candidatus Omnitrophota bacterium]